MRSPSDVPFDEIIQYWDEIDKKGTDIAGIRGLCKEDRFYLLVKVCRRTDMMHPWIYERCREVERDTDEFLDLWSREHYKSTIITFGGVIQAILRDPEITIGIFSYSNKIAEPFLRQIKNELEANQVLLKAFPDILYENPAKDSPQWSLNGLTVKRKGNPKENTIEANGLVDGQPIGKHYKLRVYDDVVVPESVNTPEQISKTTNAYSMSQSLGVEGGKEWMIGTRYSYADTYSWILERGALKARLYPATDDGTKDGKPVLFSQEEWDKRCVKNTDSDIACQYLQDPLSGSEKMFDVTYLQKYEVRPSILNVYVMCDPARSKKKTSDKTAIVVVGVDYAMNKYLLDGFDHRMDLKERWEKFASMYIRWKGMAGVQNVYMGYEAFGAQADLDYFKEQMRMPDRPKFNITELAWPREGEGSKIDRVQRLTPDLKTSKIMLPYNTDPKNLTRNQRSMIEQGYSYRVSQPIKRMDENGKSYNLAESLKTQFHFFPFGKKDLIDAFSRIYDMEPKAPSYNEPRYIEPEFS
jgi:hypothetical protein